MTRRLNYIAFLICALWFISMSGCDTEDTSTYDVTISWHIGGLDICKTVLPENYGGGELEFQEIQISVYNDENSDLPLREDIEPCGIHETTIAGLGRGTYFVKLGAMATYNEIKLPYFQASGEIVAGSDDNDTFQFPLELGTGTVNVKWGFQDGGQCGEYGVVSVTTTLVSTGSRAKEYSHEDLPCNPEPGKATGDTFKEVQWDIYNLTVEGYDADGLLTHKGIASENLQVLPGQEINVERIPLEQI